MSIIIDMISEIVLSFVIGFWFLLCIQDFIMRINASKENGFKTLIDSDYGYSTAGIPIPLWFLFFFQFIGIIFMILL